MEHNAICRCCGLSFSSHKELFIEYFDGDIKIVYSEILMNTFNISISHQKENIICQDCIWKLTEAMKFKHQVMVTENRLINTICCMKTEGLMLLREHTHKSQVKSEDIKIEDHYQQETLSYNDDWSPDTGHDIIKENTLKSNIEVHMRDTSLKLLQNSNACLFVSQKTKFKCFYCINSYITMSKLREHASIHKNESHLNYVFRNMRQFSTRNVDITNLRCNFCRIPCNALEDLRTHLSTSHAVTFDSRDHLLVPYRLTVTDEYSCTMCNEKFTTFHSLNIHMNSHSTANVCDVCGMSFWSRIKLRMHIYSQHKRKKCNVCSESFKTASLKARHMRSTHQKGVPRRICPECGEIFTYDHQLTDHRIRTHNLKRKLYKCKECIKEFKLSCNLNKHVRNVHRGEKRFSCEICSMRFSSKSDISRHGKSHDSEKRFSCNYCNCKFKSKDSWRRHLKKQHDHVQNELEIKV